MAEEISLTWIVGILITGMSVLAGFIIQQQLRKDRRKDTVSQEQIRAADLAALNIEKAQTLADTTLEKAENLQTKTEAIAENVKTSMLAQVNSLLATLRQEIELERTKIYANMSAREVKLDRIIKDFEEFRRHVYTTFREFSKSIERIQTMAWGPDAKSVPAYMMGEVETAEHKEEDDVGVFYRQTQEEEDEQTGQNVQRQHIEKKDKDKAEDKSKEAIEEVKEDSEEPPKS